MKFRELFKGKYVLFQPTATEEDDDDDQEEEKDGENGDVKSDEALGVSSSDSEENDSADGSTDGSHDTYSAATSTDDSDDQSGKTKADALEIDSIVAAKKADPLFSGIYRMSVATCPNAV